MECRITILCDNTVEALGLVGELGFSAFVEIPGQNILFDTGQGFGIIQNSHRLKKDLRQVSRVVLSHGHGDHVGGLLAFLGVRGACPITAHPDIFNERFRLMLGPDGQQQPVSIGVPWPQAYLSTRGAQFEWCTDFTEIAPDVFLTGEVPRTTSFELGDPKFHVHREGGGWMPDPLLDDFSMVFKTSRGLVVLLGCAHAGTVNILNHVIDRTGEKRIYAILGGTHLGLSPEARLDPTIEALKEFDIQMLAMSHCTGQEPMARMSCEFGKKFAFGRVGFVLEVQ